MARILGLPQECGAEVLSQPAAVGVQAGTFSVGRARLPCMLGKFGPSSHEMLMGSSVKPSKFAFTTHSTQTMQSIAVAVQMSEPLLLVGESGTGKTTIIQHIAQQVQLFHYSLQQPVHCSLQHSFHCYLQHLSDPCVCRLEKK